MTQPPPVLDSFDAKQRLSHLKRLAGDLQGTHEATPPQVNMHAHTFFSYNGYGASPSHVAWRAKHDGWHAAGICDFDVLDGMEEFLTAGDLLGLRTAVFMETRCFFNEYADQEINSPGEPGIFYFMGAGFVHAPPTGSAAADQLQAMRLGAANRNRELIQRVNDHLAPLALDYKQDVLPLTPAGNATERHICTAYYEKSRATMPDAGEWTRFWADKLGLDEAKVGPLFEHPMDFNDAARSKLMKAGGPGYVSPTPETFPALDDVIAMIQASDAIPMAAWLDGTTDGEADPREQLECLIGKGVEAVNIIPDRNWNISDPATREDKVHKFHTYVQTAIDLGLPINVGTELNKYGQRWIDDFTADAMKPVADTFIQGARVMVGHTRLLRFAGVSYCGDKAHGEYPDRHDRNRAFAAIGALPAPSPLMLERLKHQEPDANYATLQDAASSGQWPV